jgi:D-alanyl-D-alanine carboxypeptidase (penicillin-binding protein 5/6)
MRARWLLGLGVALAACPGRCDPQSPPLTAVSAILVEESTGRVLFEKDADTKRFPASTTKIMTAILVIERCTQEELIVAPADIKQVKPSSMHLAPGERVPVRDILYALMLRSANDAAVAAAVHIAGSLPAFAELMNAKAKALGCTDTHFVTPNGLHDDLHYTTARDLSRIARYAMTLPLFREIVKTPRWMLTRSTNLQDLLVESRNKLLKYDPSVEGIKTGFTNPAGSCFVGAATRENMRLFTVVLHSKDWAKDTEALLNWGYKYYGKAEVVTQAKEITSFPVEAGAKATVAAAAGEGLTAVKSKNRDDLLMDMKADGLLKAPIKVGQRVGTLTVTDKKGSFHNEIPLVSTEEVGPQGNRTASIFVGGGAFLALYAGIRRKRQRVYARYG